jgi:hypothetical protein
MYKNPMTEFYGNHTELYTGVLKVDTSHAKTATVVKDIVTMEDIKAEVKPDEPPIELKVK